MNKSLIILSAVFSIFIIILILYLVRNEKISVKFSLIWIILFSMLLISLFIPGLLEYFTKLFGFKTPSNMVLSIIIGVLIIININNTIINSSQDKKIRLLIQEVSLLSCEKKK